MLLAALFILSLCGCGNAQASAADDSDSNSPAAAGSTVPGDFPGEPPEGGPGGVPPEGTPGGTPPGDPPDGNGGPGGTPPGGFDGGMPGGGPGRSSADIDYAGAVEVTSADTQTGRTYISTTVDESALLISTSDKVAITDPTVSKSGDSDGGDSCNF